MRRDEQGFTLVEVLVTTLLVAVVGAFSLAFLVNTTTATAIATSSAEAEKAAQLTLREVSEEVRGAQNIRSTYPGGPACPTTGTYPSSYGNCVRFDVVHTNLTSQSCPMSTITYGVDNGVLRMAKTDFSGASCSATVTTNRVLLRDLTGSTPLFTFYGIDGSVLTASRPVDDWVNASAVKVTVSIRHRQGSPAVTVSTTLALRNNR